MISEETELFAPAAPAVAAAAKKAPSKRATPMAFEEACTSRSDRRSSRGSFNRSFRAQLGGGQMRGWFFDGLNENLAGLFKVVAGRASGRP